MDRARPGQGLGCPRGRRGVRADEVAHGFTEEELKQCFCDDNRMTFEQFLVAMDGKSAGAVRVSLGIASNFADVYAFSRFARGFLDRLASEVQPQ